MIPEKYFYTIGDVSKLTGVKPHVLRYWEGQFKLLRPARRYSGHRKFTPKDIDLINKVKFLIIDKKYTLAGAKREINRQMSVRTKAEEPASFTAAMPLLREIKKDIEECLEILGPASNGQE
jgi:DNA-binding transcriptional MerR regulator